MCMLLDYYFQRSLLSCLVASLSSFFFSFQYYLHYSVHPQRVAFILHTRKKHTRTHEVLHLQKGAVLSIE